MLASYDAKNPAAFARLRDSGVQMRPFSTEIMRAGQTEAFAIFEELASADEGYRTVYESWKTVRDASYQWFATADGAFAAYSFPA